CFAQDYENTSFAINARFRQRSLSSFSLGPRPRPHNQQQRKPANMDRPIKFVLIAGAALLTTVSAYAEPDQTTQVIFKNLMAATVSNNYDGFIAECDATMKAALTKPMLEGVSKQIEP